MYLRVVSIIICLITAIAVSPVCADIYKYVDANGVMHFTDRPTTNVFKLYRAGIDDPMSAISRLVRHFAKVYKVDESLVRAVIKAESNYDSRAVSKAGAQGLMQIVPKTARYLGVSDPFNPRQAIRGGTYYLRKLLDRFSNNLDLALAAYNAGPTTVSRYGGIPPYPETQNYVKKVKRFMRDYRTGKDAIL